MSADAYCRQFAENSIAVFWDIEDCKIPAGLGATDVAQNIRKSLNDAGYCGTVSIMAYGDTEPINDALISAGITPIHVAKAGEKLARVIKIVNGLWGWAFDHRFERSNLMMIMGDMSQDGEFIRTLHLLVLKRFNILLSQPPSASGQLLYAAPSVWLWTSLALGGAPIPESQLQERREEVDESDSEENDGGEYDSD